MSKPKLKKYFIEFVMIFLAITLGFLAENLRESINARGLEEEYMRSFVRDLKEDTVKLNFLMTLYESKLKYLDTLQYQLQPTVNSDRVLKSIYRGLQWSRNFRFFQYNDVTIQRLRNSGDIGIIRNVGVYDSLAKYDIEAKNISITEGYAVDIMEQAIPLEGRIFDVDSIKKWEADSKADLNAKSLDSPESIRQLRYLLLRLSKVTGFLKRQLTDQRKFAIQLIHKIDREYR